MLKTYRQPAQNSVMSDLVCQDFVTYISMKHYVFHIKIKNLLKQYKNFVDQEGGWLSIGQ